MNSLKFKGVHLPNVIKCTIKFEENVIKSHKMSTKMSYKS